MMTYLDYAGAGQPDHEHVMKAALKLMSKPLVNPHSSIQAHEELENVRQKLLCHLVGAKNSQLFDLYWCRNATEALRMFAEALQFDVLVLLRDNHTSAVGLSTIASKTVVCDTLEDLFVKIKDLEGTKLLVIPAQSNFNGYRYNVNRICAELPIEDVHVMLDTASYFSLSTMKIYSQATLSKVSAMVFSSYKLLGYPTGLGALVVRKNVQLSGDYFGGGSIDALTVSVENGIQFRCKQNIFEHGTLPYTEIMSLDIGLDVHNELYTNCDLLAAELCIQTLSWMLSCQHWNGLPVFKLHHSSEVLNLARYLSESNNMDGFSRQFQDDIYSKLNSLQGPIIAFQVLSDSGNLVGSSIIRTWAESCNIILRTGMMCNPGSAHHYLKLADYDVHNAYAAGYRCGRPVAGSQNYELDVKLQGCCRISFGRQSTQEDVDAFKNFVHRYLRVAHQISMPQQKKNNLQMWLIDICVYPIKSCAAYSLCAQDVNEWRLNKNGRLMYDREWLLVSSVGRALTQKQFPKLALITCSFDFSAGILIVSFKSLPPLMYNLEMCASSVDNLLSVTVCGSTKSFQKVSNVNAEVVEWYSSVIGIKCHLARSTSSSCSNTGDSSLLMIKASQVRELNLILESPVLISRFRPNLIVDHCAGLKSDNQLNVMSCADCQRCSLVNVDQESAQISSNCEPFRTICQQYKCKFGQYVQIRPGLDGTQMGICLQSQVNLDFKQ